MRITRRGWLAGSAAAAVSPALASADDPLKVLVLPTSAATPYYYALHEGLFTKAGLAVDFQPTTSGNLAIQAIVVGAAHVGLTNLLSLAQAHVHGVPLQAIFGAGFHNREQPIQWMFVADDGPIRTAKDLEDHTVAVSGLHDLGSLAVRAWLAQGSADSTRVRFIELPEEQMLSALQAKRVDAIVTFEPFTTAVVESKTARTLATPFDAIAPQFDVTVWAAYGPFLAANRDRFSRFVRVLRQATAYTNAHFNDVAPILASYTKIDVETVRRGLRAKTALDPVPGNLQPVIDVAARFGELSTAFPARDIIPNPAL
jgi:NitT/TauT family transport system substrate-binding protein